MQRSGGCLEAKAVGTRLDVRHAVAGADRHPTTVGLAKKRVENGSCPVRRREEFPVFLRLEFDADFPKERHRPADVKGGQNTANNVGIAAVKVGGRDRTVGDIAPSAARYENLGAEFPGSVEHDDRQRRGAASREDAAGQAGGAAPDDRGVYPT